MKVREIWRALALKTLKWNSDWCSAIITDKDTK